jgi:regulator of replication initiation timing
MSDLELTMMRRVGELNKEVASLKAENARLKTEVQHLMVFCNCTLIPNKELQAQVERLTKAGDAICESPYLWETDPAVIAWRAAKEGKQP